jgi:hypothetical protein
MIADEGFHFFQAQTGICFGGNKGSLIGHILDYKLESDRTTTLNERIRLSSRHFFDTEASS